MKQVRGIILGRILGRATGLFAAMAFALLVLAGQAIAASSYATERVRVELMPEQAGLPTDGGIVWIALHQRISPSWHTYWKNPGDSGEPTEIDWDLPAGFAAGEIEWQPPERQPYGPLVNFGYELEAILLIPITVPAGLAPGTHVPIRAQVFWLVCADVCVPEEGSVDLSLPVVMGAPTQNFAAVDVFARARERLGQPSPWDARFDETDGELQVALLGADLAGPLAEGRISGLALFPDTPGLIDNAAEQVIRFGPEGLTLSIPSGAMFRRGAAPETLSGLIRIDEEIAGEPFTRSITIDAARGTIPPGAMERRFAASRGNGAGFGLGKAALFALLGGLILNLMPCVFPIVFLKALTFVSVAHERPWRVRMHGLYYTAGILLSFTLIAAALIGLRAAGQEIGWGFQLQSPQVVAAFAALLFVVGLNLSGVYVIGTSIMGLGGSLAERRGLSGSFFTGVLAVIVAAPCTAPFMGLALGFALTQPPLAGIAIFIALGFGMALPYLLLSFAPALLKLFPRPGAWMERLKQFLAIPIYAWVIYLLWVLAQQVSISVVVLVMALLLVLALGAWGYGIRHSEMRAALPRLAAVIGLVIVMGGIVALLPRGGVAASASGGQEMDAIPSIAYSAETVSQLRLEDRTIFVNFTAAWCITCLLNERIVFSDPAVVERFQDASVIYMKGDWTNRDAEIARALESFNRPGVPLYVVYRPGEAPHVLPQVLTSDILLDALEN